MKKHIGIVLLIALVFTCIGCSPKIETRDLSFIYKQETIQAVLIQYENSEGKSLLVKNEEESPALALSQGDFLTINEEFDVIYLIVQKKETEETIQERPMRETEIEIDVSQGQYIYTFIVDWGDETGRYIKDIHVQ